MRGSSTARLTLFLLEALNAGGSADWRAQYAAIYGALVVTVGRMKCDFAESMLFAAHKQLDLNFGNCTAEPFKANTLTIDELSCRVSCQLSVRRDR